VCFSQQHINRCNFDSLYSEHIKSSEYRALLLHEQHLFQNYQLEKNGSETYTIPVVVHIVKNESVLDMNITDEDVYRQIEILNESYNLLNEDIGQTPLEFEEFIGNPQIEFCLATVDPNGYSTTGITRSTTEVSSFSPSSDNIKHSELGGVDAWDTDSYLNIWVGKLSSTVLGYSYTPTSPNVEDGEHGVAIGYPYFANSGHEFYGMGKTAVHEVGHYLNLKHPWGSGNCDENNDWVADTPISEEAYYGNPIHPQTSCESVDMFMNYMDYVHDSSMVMFSEGQAVRMRNSLIYYRPTLLESNGCGIPMLIAEPEVIHASSTMSEDASINLNIVSGIPPFEINWDEGSTLDSIGGLSAGEYSVSITDSIGQELNLNFDISYYGDVFDSDNFESYNIDSLLYTQSSSWEAFCADSFAANIAAIAPIEGTQYMEINTMDGINTVSRAIDSLTSSAYNLSFKLYVPQGRGATYSVFHNADCVEPLSAYKLEFLADGQGFVRVSGEDTLFSFPQNQWFDVNQLIDLDRDIVELSIDGNEIYDWNFNNTIESEFGNDVLDAIVFGTELSSNSIAHFFVDDYKMILTQNSDLTVEEYIEDIDVVLYPNPTQHQINLRSVEQQLELCQVYLLNTLGQVLQSQTWDAQKDGDLKMSVDEYEQGIYFLRLQSENKVRVLKFVVSR
jgi:hypothetical protein